MKKFKKKLKGKKNHVHLLFGRIYSQTGLLNSNIRGDVRIVILIPKKILLIYSINYRQKEHYRTCFSFFSVHLRSRVLFLFKN